MIRQMLSWEMSWRSRTASFIAFCTVLGVVAGIFVAINDQVQAQTARPLVGTLIVKVPRGLLPTEDYWLYVNGQIVSAPPYGPFAMSSNEYLFIVPRQTEVARYVYLDRSGVAAQSEGGRFTYLEPSLRERVFESQPIQLAPGKYVVELLVRAIHPHRDDNPLPFPWAVTFPFAVARIEAQVAAGKTENIEFGIPTGATDGRTPARGFGGYGGVSPQRTLERIQSEFTGVVRGYEADPVVPVLNQILLNLLATPPSQSSVFANLPDSMGGGRELDVQQVSLVIQQLEQEYKLPYINSGISLLHRAAPPFPQLAGQLELQIGQHNKRIDNFRQIVKALEQAKRQ